MTKQFITKKQRNLLLNSTVLNRKEFRDIKDFLEKNETISFEVLKNHPKGQAFQASLPNLLLAAQSEWVADDNIPAIDLGDDFKKIGQSCSLCGKKPLRWKCPIKNQNSGLILIVGSECAKEFGDEIHLKIKHYLKEAEKASRIKFLNEKFESIDIVVKNWDKKLEEYPIVISEELEIKWKELGKKIYDLYYGFINRKKGKGVLHYLNKLLKEREKLIKKIEQYVEDNKTKPYIASSDLARWLIKNDKKDVLDIIKKDCGFITWKSAHRITQKEFMEELAQKFNKHLEIFGVRISKVRSDKNDYILKLKVSPSELEFVYNYSEFVLNYGGLIFQESLDEPFNIREVFLRGKLFGKESNELVLKELIKLIPEYTLVYKSFSENEVIFEYKEEYLLLSFSDITEKFKLVILKERIEPIEIIKFINRISRKMDNRSYKLHLEAKKVAREEARWR